MLLLLLLHFECLYYKKPPLIECLYTGSLPPASRTGKSPEENNVT
jgi:hypothetical protein